MRIRAELCCVGQRDSPGYMREKEKLRTRRSSTLSCRKLCKNQVLVGHCSLTEPQASRSRIYTRRATSYNR